MYNCCHCVSFVDFKRRSINRACFEKLNYGSQDQVLVSHVKTSQIFSFPQQLQEYLRGLLVLLGERFEARPERRGDALLSDDGPRLLVVGADVALGVVEADGCRILPVRLDAELAAEALGGVRLALVLLHLGHVVVAHCRLHRSKQTRI